MLIGLSLMNSFVTLSEQLSPTEEANSESPTLSSDGHRTTVPNQRQAAVIKKVMTGGTNGRKLTCHPATNAKEFWIKIRNLRLSQLNENVQPTYKLYYAVLPKREALRFLHHLEDGQTCRAVHSCQPLRKSLRRKVWSSPSG